MVGPQPSPLAVWTLAPVHHPSFRHLIVMSIIRQHIHTLESFQLPPRGGPLGRTVGTCSSIVVRLQRLPTSLLLIHAAYCVLTRRSIEVSIASWAHRSCAQQHFAFDQQQCSCKCSTSVQQA